MNFLKVVDDPATGKFFLRGAGGRHRTGVMGAEHADLFPFTLFPCFPRFLGFGHGKQKSFVQDYWQEFQAKQANASMSATGGR